MLLNQSVTWDFSLISHIYPLMCSLSSITSPWEIHTQMSPFLYFSQYESFMKFTIDKVYRGWNVDDDIQKSSLLCPLYRKLVKSVYLSNFSKFIKFKWSKSVPIAHINVNVFFSCHNFFLLSDDWDESLHWLLIPII